MDHEGSAELGREASVKAQRGGGQVGHKAER